MAYLGVQNDLTICSICFEKFKTPRALPCSHVFCHNCISTYIVSSCESKEAPVGFSCPLCREFVPSPTVIAKPDTWAECLPICEIIDKLAEVKKLTLCLPCQRENDEEEATDMCITCQEPICKNCAKYHKRNLTSRNHHMVSFNEQGKVLEFFKTEHRKEWCPQHPDKIAELHCNQHQTLCCAQCAVTEHWKCSDVETIQSVAEKTKKGEVLGALRRKINKYEHEMLTSKEKQENNLTQIECTAESIRVELQKIRQEVNDHLTMLENEDMDKLSQITKQSKAILSKNIDSLSDRINFSRQCIQSLQKLEEASDMNDVCFMKEYHRVRENFELLERRTDILKEHELMIKSKISRKPCEITKLKSLVTLSVDRLEKELRVRERYIPELSLKLVSEFEVVPHDDIYGGVLHSDGSVTLAKFGFSNKGLQKFAFKAGRYEQTMYYYSVHCFFGLALNEDKFYTTSRNENSVCVISSDTFYLLRKIPIDDNFSSYGVCLWNEFLFVACQTAIIKYSIHGRFIHEYLVDFNTLFVTVTSSGNIVFTNSKLNFVASMNESGNQLWKYMNSKLRLPHSVDKDGMDNLYVASTDTNSIHILSCDGSLIRIVEDIPKPIFMKVQASNRTCCVCSKFGRIKVYEMI